MTQLEPLAKRDPNQGDSSEPGDLYYLWREAGSFTKAERKVASIAQHRLVAPNHLSESTSIREDLPLYAHVLSNLQAGLSGTCLNHSLQKLTCPFLKLPVKV